MENASAADFSVDWIPVSLLAAGQSAWVRQLIGSPEDVHRLEELGVRRGAALEMLQPGNPCILRVSGSKLCFRDGDAFRILVQLGTAGE